MNKVRDNIENIYELTPLQKGMLFNYLNNISSSDYHVQYEIDFDYLINKKDIEKCMECLFNRYEMLRTSFVVTKSMGVPRQIVLKYRQPEIHYVSDDISVEEIKIRDLNKPFDLQTDCLLRLYVFSNGYYSKILFTFHHIIMDGWSADIFFNEFDELCKLMFEGKAIENLNSDTFKFSNYVNWINKQSSLQGIEYWKNMLSGYENSISIEKNPIQDSILNTVERVKKEYNGILSKEMSDLAKRLNVTVSSIVETIWGIVLGKYNYVDDVVFGKVVSGRQADIEGIEKAIGMFINTIPTRIKIEDNCVVEELIKVVHKQNIDSIEHSYCLLGDIEKEFSQKLINIIYIFENYGTDSGTQEGMKIKSAREQIDCDITCIAYIEDGNINVELMYDPHNYLNEDMKIILERMEKICFQICNVPMLKIGEIELALECEISKMFNEFNCTETEIQYDNIIQMFDEKVTENPDKVIAVCNEKEITYLELYNKVNRCALELVERGIKKQQYVIIMVDRSIEMLITMLSILRIGAIYIPIDKSYPRKRIEYIVKDTAAKLIISDEDNLSYLDCDCLNIADFFNGVKKSNCNCIQSVIDDKDVAYCIYTSGTTGNPKGVLITHNNLVNYCNKNKHNIMGKVIKNDNAVIISVTTFTFDIFVTESLLSLVNGVKIIIANNDEYNDPNKIGCLIEKHNVNIIQTTPSKMQLLLCDNNKFLENIKVILLGGESVSMKLYRKIKICSGAEIYNVYGPTETTVWSTICEYKKENIIGRPIANTKVYIMNGKNLCGVEMIGEICILGKGVAKGYVNNQELTKQKFVYTSRGKMYKTGDLGKWTKDGQILFLGRRDDQIKVRGLRIELKEIEQCIKRVEGIKDVIVLIDKNKNICAFYVSDVIIDRNYINEQISKMLPSYMLPTKYIKVEKMPVNLSGKLDKKKLLSFDNSDNEKDYIPPISKKEKEIVKVFIEVLAHEKIGMNDNFFDLGGDSMKAIIAITKLENMGYSITLRDIMKSAKIGNIIKRTEES